MPCQAVSLSQQLEVMLQCLNHCSIKGSGCLESILISLLLNVLFISAIVASKAFDAMLGDTGYFQWHFCALIRECAICRLHGNLNLWEN